MPYKENKIVKIIKLKNLQYRSNVSEIIIQIYIFKQSSVLM